MKSIVSAQQPTEEKCIRCATCQPISRQSRHSKQSLHSAFWPVNRYNFVRAIGAKG
jgi:hypothetical protein